MKTTIMAKYYPVSTWDDERLWYAELDIEAYSQFGYLFPELPTESVWILD